VLRRHGFIDEDINTSGTVGWQKKGLGRGWEGIGEGAANRLAKDSGKNIESAPPPTAKAEHAQSP